ncbi:MAG: ABC-type organic solvent transporter, solute-binding periplasmic protein [Pseudobdellovibrio sp.]|nr:ABC-type organic solvent transporter, solute-binding periplasmic protein [Pseudobdellovibrio sp.]
MNFLKLPEFKVGLLVVAIGGLIAFMSMQVSDDPSLLGRAKRAWFLMPTAQGLVKGSAIKSAGIPVGVIKDITLQDGKARIDVTIKDEIGLKRSAAVGMKANGILGDKSIEVYPGDEGDPELEDGGQIVNVKTGGGLDDVMTQVSDLAGNLKEITKNLKEATAGDGTDKHILGRIVINIEKITKDLSQVTGDNKEQIKEIVDQVNEITGTINELVNDDSPEGFKSTWKKTMVRLDNSMKNIDEITTKINKGEGAIGKLISDEQTGEDISTAIEGISGLVDTANKVSTGIDFNSHYLGTVGSAKTAIGVTIQPGLDRYYYLGIITDPAGVVERKEISTTTGGSTTDVEEEVTFKNKTKITAFFGKHFFDWTLRGGLIEDTGGVGIDYHMLDRKLTATVEAYDFQKIQVRSFLTYRMFYGLYLTAGYNDMLDKKNASSAFLGAGLFLTNDDLKLLLTKSPF